jgi:subtilisin family serine protease
MTDEEREFILNSPDAVDFVVRRSEYFFDQFEDNPNVIVAQRLEDRYTIAFTNVGYVDTLIEAMGTSFVSSAARVMGLLDRASLEASGIVQVQYEPYLALTGQNVLIGFIDTGIDYTLPIFRYEDGSSKIQYIYDQTIDGNPPAGFYMGTEYTNEQINYALTLGNPLEAVPSTDTVGHGTFLASIAAGRTSDDFTGAAPNSELIVVKLRKARPFYLERYAVPVEQENAYETTDFMVGVQYVVDKARELQRPVIICIGVGTNFGSHDGFSIFEEYLSNLSNLRGICICAAAGNEAQARHHTQGTIPTNGESRNIDIRVGNEGTNIYLSIWNTVGDKMSVTVVSPTGEVVGRVPARPGSSIEEKLILEPSTVRVEYYFPVEGSGDQLIVVKVTDATPGIWSVTLYGEIILSGLYDAWLPLTGFIDPGTVFLASDPYTTITVPGTMLGCICCGAYDYTTNSLYAESSWGPTRSRELAPTLVAPGVNVVGRYPTEYGTMSGTSVSAAITAGACALLMEWGFVRGNDPSMSTYQIRAFMIRGCDRNESVSYPNNQRGFGTLDLLNTFRLMREV